MGAFNIKLSHGKVCYTTLKLNKNYIIVSGQNLSKTAAEHGDVVLINLSNKERAE
jgi:hypothetical protein